MKQRSMIAIIGAGAWGTALASAISHNGTRVLLLTRNAAQATAINSTHHNPRALSQHELPVTVRATDDWNEITAAELCLLATPAQATRTLLPQIGMHLPLTVPLLFCSKGLEAETGLRQSELARQLLPAQPLGVLSGPSFAIDTINNLPTAIVLAAQSLTQADYYAQLLAAPRFRLYPSDDMIGIELAGALKNVLALGAGIVVGAGLGENARAALITRGLAELTRLGEACGGRASTFAGLAGVGDVILTCSSTTSRNFACGYTLGQGQPLAQATQGRTVEGVPTIGAALRLAAAKQIALPITAALDRLINHGARLELILDELLTRPLRPE